MNCITYAFYCNLLFLCRLICIIWFLGACLVILCRYSSVLMLIVLGINFSAAKTMIYLLTNKSRTNLPLKTKLVNTVHFVMPDCPVRATSFSLLLILRDITSFFRNRIISKGLWATWCPDMTPARLFPLGSAKEWSASTQTSQYR